MRLVNVWYIQYASGARVGDKKLRVFTTRPETVFGVTFIAVAAEHDLALEGYGE